MDVIFTVNYYFLVRDDVSIDSGVFLMIKFINLKIKLRYLYK
jgi:hypothetical protein